MRNSTLFLDFIRGYDFVAHSSYLIHKNNEKIIMVGDYDANFKIDIYNQWNDPKINIEEDI